MSGRQEIGGGRDPEAKGAPGMNDVLLVQDHVDFGAGRSCQKQVECQQSCGEAAAQEGEDPCRPEISDAHSREGEAVEAVLVVLAAAAEVAEIGA